jgi:hypothetical protein
MVFSPLRLVKIWFKMLAAGAYGEEKLEVDLDGAMVDVNFFFL